MDAKDLNVSNALRTKSILKLAFHKPAPERRLISKVPIVVER